MTGLGVCADIFTARTTHELQGHLCQVSKGMFLGRITGAALSLLLVKTKTTMVACFCSEGMSEVSNFLFALRGMFIRYWRLCFCCYRISETQIHKDKNGQI